MGWMLVMAGARRSEPVCAPPRPSRCRYAQGVSDRATTSGISLDPERLAGWMRSEPALQVIDVRERYERDAGHIEGSRHIELTRLNAEADSVSREAPVVFYCRVGARSAMAAEAFRASGYEAYSLDGGLLRWAAEQRPLAPEGGIVADH